MGKPKGQFRSVLGSGEKFGDPSRLHADTLSRRLQPVSSRASNRLLEELSTRNASATLGSWHHWLSWWLLFPLGFPLKPKKGYPKKNDACLSCPKDRGLKGDHLLGCHDYIWTMGKSKGQKVGFALNN